MNEQLSATSTLAAGSAAPAAPQDAWDRLAALTFGDAATEGGCSEHTHDCTCLAAGGAAEAVALEQQPPSTEWPSPEAGSAGWSEPGDESAGWPDAWSAQGGGRAAWSVPGEPPAPDPERPADPEAEPPFSDPGMLPPDPERPVFPDSEPEPTPPLEPGPQDAPAPETGV